jgi:hypothetical protein
MKQAPVREEVAMLFFPVLLAGCVPGPPPEEYLKLLDDLRRR